MFNKLTSTRITQRCSLSRSGIVTHFKVDIDFDMTRPSLRNAARRGLTDTHITWPICDQARCLHAADRAYQIGLDSATLTDSIRALLLWTPDKSNARFHLFNI
jgi:hypothetical protein